MTWMDPIDHFLYWGIVGRFVKQMESLVDRSRVLSAQLKTGPPGWRLANPKDGVVRRRRKALAALTSSDCHVMGVTDIRDYYPSISEDLVRGQLGYLPGNGDTLRFLMDWFDQLQNLYGVPGLPVGPEPSSVIGNFLLTPLDASLSESRIPFLRYMDDVWVFVPDEQSFWVAMEAGRTTIESFGLELHEDKTKCLSWIDALNYVQSAMIEYALGAPVQDLQVELSAAQMLFDDAVERPEERSREIRRALNVFRKHGDPYPLQFLMNKPSLLGAGWQEWDRYLTRMTADKGTRRAIDRDWLLERVLAPYEAGDIAERVVLGRALRNWSLPKDCGDRLSEMALDRRGWSTPVRVIAAEALGRTEGWNGDAAVEAAEQVGDLSTRRALTLTLRRLSRGRKAHKQDARLLRMDPDLGPTVKWVAA